MISVKASDIERQTKKCCWRFGIFSNQICRRKIFKLGMCRGHWYSLLEAEDRANTYKKNNEG